jgi:UPF0755 protein
LNDIWLITQSEEELTMYKANQYGRRPWLRRALTAVGVLILLLILATLVIWKFYYQNLLPVSSHATTQSVVIDSGATPTQIANLLHNKGIIRNAWTFEAYVRHEGVGADLQAGTYNLSASQSVQTIVGQLTHGKVTTELVTILPGQTIAQIKQSLLSDGFKEADVTAALNPSLYENNAALVDKPKGNSLEGYLYPDSFQRTSSTTATMIVQESIAEMQKHLTPDIRAAFAKEGLSTYQGIVIASVVEREVSKASDRPQVAQVFLSRYAAGTTLGSDVTAYYGSQLAGKGNSIAYDSPYNTRINVGLPPTPISNVDDSALQSVAHPASTQWQYFVSGDDGTTYFSTTLEEHNAQTAQYCKKLCQ